MDKLATIDDIANKSFDFVIIGGGLAGCVLAARLSENPDVTVAVLEAGNAHFDDPLVKIPDGWTKQVYNPEYDWVFRTTVQKRAANGITTPDGGSDPSFYWARGKGLGGSSCINFLYWTRPQREEIDAIEKLGNKGWNWERFFEASKRAESFRASAVVNNDPDYRNLYVSESVGHNGPVAHSFARTVSGVERHFQNALKSFGVEVLSDGLGGEIAGTFKATNNVDPETGSRTTAATGYLIPALGRPNLKVLTGAYVRRIITTNKSGRVAATGVEFEHGGIVHVVNVAKDALLCASTVKSPHVLELSGIGDRAILEPLGIPVQVDLPAVGTNLQDHLISAAFVYEMKSSQGFVTTDTMSHPDIDNKLRTLYGESDVPISLSLSGVSFIPIHIFSDRAEELIARFEERVRKDATLSPGLREQYELQLDMLKRKNVPDIEIVTFPYNMHPDGSGKPYIAILPSTGHPFARGTIHAGSSDPAVQPVIDPDYLSESLDMDILLDSMKFLRKVTQTDEWKAVGHAEVLPGPAVVTDEQLIEFTKKNLSTTWHSCGTCSMMPHEKGGVVDTSLKVYGTTNIRVVDLSILPLLTAVHTQATTYGIAEQGADIIKAEHGL